MTTQSKIGTNGTTVPSPEQLSAALFDVQDALQRASIPFIVLRDAARSLFFEEPLKGNYVCVSAYERYFTDSCLAMLHDVRPQLKKSDHGYEYTFDTVPVEIRVIRKHFHFLDNPDMRCLFSEEFNIPNPFCSYWKSRSFV